MDGTINYFNQAAAGWSERYATSGHFRDRLEIVLTWVTQDFSIAPTDSERYTALDFGCGSGILMTALLQAGFHVTGVDASPRMLEAASRQLNDTTFLEVMDYILEQVDATDFSGRYLKKQYHLVCCLGVLEYVEDPHRLLQRLASVVAPGGQLILSVPNQNSMLRTLERFIYTHPAWFRPFVLFPHLTGPDAYLQHQRHQFTATQLQRELGLYGLVPTRQSYQVVPHILASLAHYPQIGMTLLGQYTQGR